LVGCVVSPDIVHCERSTVMQRNAVEKKGGSAVVASLYACPPAVAAEAWLSSFGIFAGARVTDSASVFGTNLIIAMVQHYATAPAAVPPTRLTLIARVTHIGNRLQC
jgi:hypothetical protein